MSLDEPDFRAVLKKGRLSLIPWSPNLVRRGGWGNGLPSVPRDRALADLTIIRNDEYRAQEVIVTELVVGADDRLRNAVISWAGLLGYERVWFAGELVAPDIARAGVTERASCVCPTCSARWSDDSPDFWIRARHYGVFPSWCGICGHPVPQWTVDVGCRSTDRSTRALAEKAVPTPIASDKNGSGQ
jgi:hypothetical protein